MTPYSGLGFFFTLALALLPAAIAGTQLRSIASNSKTATHERWIRFIVFSPFHKYSAPVSAGGFGGHPARLREMV